MEYVNGVDLESLSPDLAKETFGKESVLKEIGHLLVFDIMINNSDRLPCIWKNDGNLKNVLVSKGHICPIDHSVFCISEPSNFENYIQRVKEYIFGVFGQPLVPDKSTSKIRDTILTFSGMDIGDEGICAIQAGVIECVFRASKITKDDLKNLKITLQNMNKHDWENIWGGGLLCIDVNFMDSILDIFKEAVKSHNH